MAHLAALYRLGYKVIIIWELDWNKQPDNCIKRIRDEMCKN